MSEPYYNFSVKIKLPSGEFITSRELAHTKWHAVDKAYTKYSDHQPDRQKYVATPPLIKLR
ncbi:MAG: hypothetical protein ACXADH_03105 [Candidatus Kariarchaeaceae archaeon]